MISAVSLLADGFVKILADAATDKVGLGPVVDNVTNPQPCNFRNP